MKDQYTSLQDATIESILQEYKHLQKQNEALRVYIRAVEQHLNWADLYHECLDRGESLKLWRKKLDLE